MSNLTEERLREIDHQRAVENESRDLRTLEYKCRLVARWANADEDDWQDYKDVVFAVEQGRLEALRTYVKTPEEAEAWRQYMMNR
jgi:hypothetical protein